MNAPFSRRDFLKLMSAVVAGSMLAACAPKPTPTAPAPTEAPKAAQPTAAPPEKKALKGKLAWYAAQAADHLPPFQEQHKMWDAMYPDVQIEEVFVPWGEYTTKMVTMIAGGESIDVVLLQLGNAVGSSLHAAYWITKDALFDFTPAFDSGKIKKEDYYAGLLKEWLVNDKFWGTPFEVFQESFWYNTDLFKAASLPIPTPEWKWEDHRKAAKELTKRSADGRAEQFGTMGTSWLDALYEAGGEPVGADGESVQLDTPEAKAGFEEWFFYTGNGYAPLGDETKSFAGLHTGKVAIQAHGNYMWTTFRQAAKDVGFDFGATLMPTGPGPAPKNKAGWVGYNLWSVFKSSKLPEAALEFAILLGYGKGAEPWAATGRVSPLKRFDLDYYQKVANFTGAEKERYASNLTTTFTNMDKGYVHPSQPYFVIKDLNWGNIQGIFDEEFTKVVVEKSQSLDQATKVANERAAKAISDARGG
jgi:ABC-type glycerol-3-phosphate transport system substrate-binding protein